MADESGERSRCSACGALTPPGFLLEFTQVLTDESFAFQFGVNPSMETQNGIPYLDAVRRFE
jgi:hypothetical protein